MMASAITAKGEKTMNNYCSTCPEADVVEVVRCRECRFSEEVNPGLYICRNENIKIVGSYVDPGWYCADGKRRKDNDRRNGN